MEDTRDAEDAIRKVDGRFQLFLLGVSSLLHLGVVSNPELSCLKRCALNINTACSSHLLV